VRHAFPNQSSDFEKAMWRQATTQASQKLVAYRSIQRSIKPLIEERTNKMTNQNNEIPADVAALTSEEYCYVTTTGRVSGRPHRIEIWFGMQSQTLYLLSGDGKSDWVKNMRVQPTVTVELGGRTFAAQTRIVSDQQEDALTRRLLAGKYQGWHEGLPFSEWAQTALPVAIDLVFEDNR
jgi:deazaflavin-dependent oxidoreductase (nitroreductase family)